MCRRLFYDSATLVPNFSLACQGTLGPGCSLFVQALGYDRSAYPAKHGPLARIYGLFLLWGSFFLAKLEIAQVSVNW